MDSKSRFGYNDKEQIEKLELVEGIHRTLRIYDSSPEVSQEVFRNCNTQSEIESRFRTSLEDACDSEQYRNIGIAFNYLKIKKLFEEGKEGDAREILEYLSREELPLITLDIMLKELGTTYTELCVENRKLLIPRELDKRVFERFCPDSVDLYQVFLNKEGICVISPGAEEGYKVSLSYMKLNGRKIQDDTSGVGVSSLFLKKNRVGFKYEGEMEDVKLQVECMFEEKGVKDYVIINSSTEDVFGYIYLRNKINRIGRAVNQVTPIRFELKSRLVKDYNEE